MAEITADLLRHVSKQLIAGMRSPLQVLWAAEGIEEEIRAQVSKPQTDSMEGLKSLFPGLWNKNGRET